MKKGFIILSVIIFILAVVFLIAESDKRKGGEDIVPELLSYRNLQNEQIVLTDVASTSELQTLFNGSKYDAMPRLFIRRFPDDFPQKGNIELFVATLLPHLLRQNELLGAERAAFLALTDKLRLGKKMSGTEEAFWDELLKKYEVLNPDRDGQEEALFSRQGKISPALGIAQSLEATQMGKVHLDSPFDVRRWNDAKVYDFVVYSNLASAVDDYALELNRGYAYANLHMIRMGNKSLTSPPSGRFMASGLGLYKLEDELYTKKLEEIFKWFKFGKLDSAAFRKE